MKPLLTWEYGFNGESSENVTRDYELFQDFEGLSCPVVGRIYTFHKHAATFGYLTRVQEGFRKRCEQSSIPLIRRCSGGGISLHGEDICFSFVFRTEMGCSRLAPMISEKLKLHLAKAAGSWLNMGEIGTEYIEEKATGREFCIMRKGEHDIVLGGLKIAGFAGRVAFGKAMVQCQLNSIGWNGGLINTVAGLRVEIPSWYERVKEIIFSEEFLSRVKLDIDLLFSNLYGENKSGKGRISWERVWGS